MLVEKKEARSKKTYIAADSDEGNLLSYFSQLCGLNHFLLVLRKSQLAKIIQSSETQFWNESHLVVKSIFSVFKPKWVKLSTKGKISSTSFEEISGSLVTFLPIWIFNSTNLGFHLENNDFRKVVESCSGRRGTSSIFTVWQKIVCERTDRKEFCRLVWAAFLLATAWKEREKKRCLGHVSTVFKPKMQFVLLK